MLEFPDVFVPMAKPEEGSRPVAGMLIAAEPDGVFPSKILVLNMMAVTQADVVGQNRVEVR